MWTLVRHRSRAEAGQCHYRDGSHAGALARRLHMIAVGGRMPPWVTMACEQYSARLPPPFTMGLHEIPARVGRAAGALARRKAQAMRIGRAISAAAELVVLDERGTLLSSEELAMRLARVLVAERLYRAATILAGHPYHRD